MADQKVYSFKAVGEKLRDWRQTRRLDTKVELPIGIKTPMQLGDGRNGLFTMNWDIDSVIADNLKNLLLTNHGDRLGMYDFGANLQELVTELGSEDFDNEAIFRIQQTVNKYMSYLTLETFETSTDHGVATSGLAAVAIKVTYSVPKLGISNKGIIVTLYAIG
tara:strand:+ start:542 stop:1030 length:489 start_codon:yes stop_codon:yes gene_type:complete